jgi:hypothetical protein
VSDDGKAITEEALGAFRVSAKSSTELMEALSRCDCPVSIRVHYGDCQDVSVFEGVTFEWDGDDLRARVRPEDVDRLWERMEAGLRVELRQVEK